MFKTRLLSGILLVVIALITVITGGNVLFATLFLISMIGVYELYRVFEIENKAVGICGFLFAAGYYGLLYAKPLLPDTTDWFMLLFMAFVICLMAVLVFSYPKYRTEQMLAAFFGVFYVAVMLSYIYQTRILPGGVFQVWLVFICAWGCDTCAYCVGMLIGKHKMAPKLGYQTFFWSLAYVDWQQDDQPTHEEAFDKLLSRVHPGAVVLLHNTSKTNGEIMEELLSKWEEMGYTFRPLSDLTKAA